MARPRQRNVGEPEILAALLADELLAVGVVVAAREADVDRALVAGRRVVKEDRARRAGDEPRLPQERQVDDRELQTLAAVDGENLDRLGVGFQAPAALLVGGVGIGLGDPRPQPGGERARAELLGAGGAVQELTDVAQIGEATLPRGARQDPRRQPLVDGDDLHQSGHAALPEDSRPAVEALVDLLPGRRVLIGGVLREAPRRPADEAGDRRGARACDRGRPLERLQQRQPLACGCGGEHAAGAVDHRRHAGVVQRVADHRRLAVGPHEHGEMPGGDGGVGVAAIPGPVGRDARARIQQRDDVAGEVARDQAARGHVADIATLGQRQRRVVAGRHAEPHRRRHRRARQPRPVVPRGGADMPVGDSLVPEPDAGEQRVVGVDQALVAAPVDRERGLGAGGARRVEVGVDVGAAEGVDRLLGVGDQNERRAAVGERAPHDLPLRGIGVLELVDEHDVEAVAQPRGGRLRAGAGQRAAQAGDEIVVGHHRHRALAPLQLGAGAERQPHAHRGHLRAGADDRRGRVLDRRPGDLGGLRAIERRRTASAEAPDVEIVDHLGDEVGEILDERDVGFEVAGDPEAAEHLLAEPVGGGDRRGVEAGDRACQQLAPAPGVLVGQQRDDRIVAGAGPRQHAGQPSLDDHQPLADALAQLAGGDPGERHQQQPLQRDALGDVTRRQRGDRVRLAGAGACLEYGDAARERAADVELSRGDRDRRDAHRALRSSRASRPPHSRTA